MATMNVIPVVSVSSESLQPESVVQHAVRIVVPSASTIAYDVPVVTPIDSFQDRGDNSITDSNQGKVGRWTDLEHTVFLEGLEKNGKQWKTIAAMIGTRSVVQVRTHAQKYFQKMDRKKTASSTSISSIDSINDESERSQAKRKNFSIAASSKKKSKIQESDSYLLSTAITNAMEIHTIPQIISATESSSECSLQKSCSTSSVDWSTYSPSTVADSFDLGVENVSSHYIIEDVVIDMDIHESVEDPLEWLIDLDTQQYLPESSLPMFPDLVEHTTADPILSQPYTVEDALLNNMEDPNITMQSLFPENEDFPDDL